MEHQDKKNEIDIQDALTYTQGIINTVHDPIIILYDDLMVALANSSFYQAFHVNAKDTEGRFIYDLGNRQWDIPKLRHLLEEILPKTTSFDNFKIEHDFLGIGQRTMLLNACRVYMESNRTKVIIITIKDVTEHNEIERLSHKIKELEARLKAENSS